MDQLRVDYPWAQTPLVSCGPMRLIALASLATEVSKAGGIGFIGSGSDVSQLDSILTEVRELQSKTTELAELKVVLPVGVGFLLWAGDKLLHDALPLLEEYKPAAVWLFAPNDSKQLARWAEETRRVTRGLTKIWIQIGTVADAVETTRTCQPDILVVQGQDAGGHGLEKGAGLIPLLPEVDDAVSALCQDQNLKKPIFIAGGGIMEGRGAAAAIALGASGVTMGTRYLAAPEANISQGYQDAVIRASDGGVTTERGKLYDQLRGTTAWPSRYGGRGVLNESWHDAARGLSFEENKRRYDEATKKGDAGWGKGGRMTTYAGTGVGLAKKVQPAADITKEVREQAVRFLKQANDRL